MTVALIPARSGSERVPGKNTRSLMSHPLIAYTVSLAKNCGLFSNVICSTDSEEIGEIAKYYGCDSVILRPGDISGSRSPDILWIEHAIANGNLDSEFIGILRVTSPVKRIESLQAALEFAISNEVDSIRAITPVREHPGKVWLLENKPAGRIYPVLETQDAGIAFHARQYQDLPQMFIQTSSFEFLRTSSVIATKSREGVNIFGYLINYPETINVDYQDEFEFLEFLALKGKIELPQLETPPFFSRNER
jgi:N-acylneuraminate cytidylyltransferase